MKSARDAFAAAIDRAEKSLRRGKKAQTETPQERGHSVTRLGEERAKRRCDEARNFARQARHFGLDDDTLAKIDAAAQVHVARPERWMFVMMGPRENAAVVRWINANSKRPHKAQELWATLLEHLRMDTGEIMATRQELAERVGMEPRTLSETMTELVSINAVRREKKGREVRYFLNPNIATHVPSPTARAKAREADGPLLVVVPNSRAENDAS